MTDADLTEVVAIERQSFTAPFSAKLFQKELQWSPAQLWVAVPEETPLNVLAYIDWWQIVDELHLINMAVREEHRRRGIGSRLVAAMLDRGRSVGARFVYLEVRCSNMGARQMYQKFGFRDFGERKGYYRDNHEDAVLMGCNL